MSQQAPRTVERLDKSFTAGLVGRPITALDTPEKRRGHHGSSLQSLLARRLGRCTVAQLLVRHLADDARQRLQDERSRHPHQIVGAPPSMTRTWPSRSAQYRSWLSSYRLATSPRRAVSGCPGDSRCGTTGRSSTLSPSYRTDP